jgi:hypothetical protein
MRKPLTDSLCAELAKDFKPFKVRLNPLKPKNGFKTSTTYRVTELRKNALHQWVIRFAKSKYDWLAENFDMIVESKAEPKRIIKGLTENGSHMHGSFLMVDDDGYTWISNALGRHKLVAIETDPIQVKAQEIDCKLKELDDTFELEFKYFDKPNPNPDNQTVNSLVQYVSEHKESMSKESILHFANLIGLIKLGAL